MQKQDVIFILDDSRLLEERSFWLTLRKSLYSLREYALKKSADVRLCFASLGKQDSSAQNLSFFDLDSFSFSQEKQSDYFSKSDFSSLNNYFSSPEFFESDSLPTIVITLTDDSEQLINAENYKRLLLLQPFANSKLIVSRKSDFERLPDQICSERLKFKAPKPQKPAFSFGAFVKNNKIILEVSSGAIVLALALFLILSLSHRETYLQVYTGDGDRLILRQKPERGANEILRLNEGETVLVLEDGTEWTKVIYHGLTGYLNKQYLIPSKKRFYKIENPDSMYSYGKACVNMELNEADGYKWIEKAANANVISAQWEMARKAEEENDTNGQDKWLHTVLYNDDSVEQITADSWRKTAESCSKEMRDHYIEKAKDKEKTIENLQILSCKKLSELYYDTNPEDAYIYYMMAITAGFKADTDYMYSLATETSLSETNKIELLKQASDLAHIQSSLYLGRYYYKKASYENARLYYSRVSYYYGAEAPYYCGKIYYEKRQYSDAVSYFRKACYSSDYSDEYYLACYALGVCYEYGYGVGRSDSTALDYYSIAKNKVSEAKKAYEKLYSEVYYSWYY